VEVIPAVDVAAGQVVQNGGDPLEVALDWQARGATRLHLVDLDVAFGRGDNRELIASIVGRLDIPVQLSGGIATPEHVQLALDAGADRVVIATQAIADRDWLSAELANLPTRLIVALDVRGDVFAPRGTELTLGAWREALVWLNAAGCRRYIVTNIDGPVFEPLHAVRELTDAKLIASGGIASPDDLAALEGIAEAAIVGTALYSGAVMLRS
jgi:phosphoribosylformimino-5-aminoimidazole carboxamide ribonucleotide (ProFAR) isomerase